VETLVELDAERLDIDPVAHDWRMRLSEMAAVSQVAPSLAEDILDRGRGPCGPTRVPAEMGEFVRHLGSSEAIPR
jgi:hypothetical protein